MKSKQGISSLDIHAIIAELCEELISGILKNVYLVGDKIFLLRIWTSQGTKVLLVEPGVRLHLTEFQRQIPERPNNKVLNLRKLVRDLRIQSLRQHHLDRLVIIELSGKSQATIIIELFGKGNIVVLDESQRVVFALWYKKMRDRDLLPGKPFTFPPPLRQKPLLEVTYDDLLNFREEADETTKLGRGLALKFGGGGELVNEVISRTALSPNDLVMETSETSLRALETNLLKLKEDLSSTLPNTIEDTNGSMISVHPIAFQSIQGKLKEFTTFNKALDSYFSVMESQNIHALAAEDSRLKRLKKTLEKQQLHLQQFHDEMLKYRSLGDDIHLVANRLEELQTTILTARRNGMSWDDIREKIDLGKQKGIESARLLERIDEKQGFININLETGQIKIDLKESPYQIAERYYSLSKKAERKIPAAEASIKEMMSQLTTAEETKGDLLAEDEVKVLRRPRKWFEKYHWAQTTNGFLIIAGKDARTNEEIVRRRLTESDLFFHASIQGAPHTLLLVDSSEGEPTDDDLIDAAVIAGSYSRAWKRGTGAIDVYHVLGTQVSFSAPSGEYVPRGGAIVRGKRINHSGVPLELGIGIEFFESWAQIIAGPVNPIQKRCKSYVKIFPGDIPKSKIAKEVRERFMKEADEVQRRLIRALDLNEFVSFIPGDSRFSRE